jgi:VanZ family protein
MRVLAVIAYVAVIFTLSSWSNPPSGPGLQLDKVVHVVEYGILGILLGWAARPRLRGGRLIALAIVLGFLVAVSDELYQRATPGRESSVVDVVADCVGLILGVLAYERRTARRP